MGKNAIWFYGKTLCRRSTTNVRELKEEEQKKWMELSLEEHMALYLDEGKDRKEAMKLVAKDRGIPKRDVYNALLNK